MTDHIDEEEHLAWLETELSLFDELGDRSTWPTA